MDYSANIPRGKISMSREFAVPFRTRSSSHTPQCNCPNPDNPYTFSSPSMASGDSSSPRPDSSQRPKQRPSNSYFHGISEINGDSAEEGSSNSSDNEQNYERISQNNQEETESPDSSNPPPPKRESSPNQRPNAPTSNYARIIAYGLIGMKIDYNGDVLDASKKSCGKASGDITEMVGQKIDEDGLIRSPTGEVVGQVAQNYGLEEAVGAMMEAQKNMAAGNSGESRENNSKTSSDERSKDRGTAGAQQEKNQELPNIWQGTVGEGQGASNDIHLNVQSTKEGISMSIRIPTLFMKEQHRQFESEEKHTANQSS